MLGVVTENSGNHVSVRCVGRLVAGENAWSLYNTVIAYENKNSFTVDLTGVDRVDARGLGVLVILKQWADGAGVKLELIPSKQVQELIELTGLTSLFENCSTEKNPVAEFFNETSRDERQCA